MSNPVYAILLLMVTMLIIGLPLLITWAACYSQVGDPEYRGYLVQDTDGHWSTRDQAEARRLNLG